MSPDVPTPQDLARELHELLEARKFSDGSGGSTVRELAVALGIGDNKVRMALQRLKLAGRLRTAKGYREGIDGTPRMAPVYWVE